MLLERRTSLRSRSSFFPLKRLLMPSRGRLPCDSAIASTILFSAKASASTHLIVGADLGNIPDTNRVDSASP
jgi:hypothetical protein